MIITTLNDLLSYRNAASNYNVRGSSNFEIQFARLCSYASSFFPSTLKLWNKLLLYIRSSSSVSQFKENDRSQHLKRLITCTLEKGNICIIFYYPVWGHNCSSLNSDLFLFYSIP